ncbi:MAG: hypothetical protein WC866_06130 [Patescibacteria group bacterium]|jgi:hypothetical protein
MTFFHWFKWLVIVVFFVAFFIVSVILLSRRLEKKRLAKVSTPPGQDRLLYDRLAAEMLAYASESGVVYHQEIESRFGEHAFVRTTSDRFGKKRYVERQRWYNGRIQYTICRYDNSSSTPSDSAICEQAVSSSARDVYYDSIRDIREHGSKISFRDGDGLNCQLRVPPKPVESRV